MAITERNKLVHTSEANGIYRNSDTAGLFPLII